ncbi:MAG: MoaD/ThiS family protein [Thermodesulfobacteriota bacterium]
MRLEVQLFASLGRFAPGGGGTGPFDVELDGDMTVAGLLERLGVPAETVKLVFVNGVHATGETPLEDGDRVGVFPPVAGG